MTNKWIDIEQKKPREIKESKTRKRTKLFIFIFVFLCLISSIRLEIVEIERFCIIQMEALCAVLFHCLEALPSYVMCAQFRLFVHCIYGADMFVGHQQAKISSTMCGIRSCVNVLRWMASKSGACYIVLSELSVQINLHHLCGRPIATKFREKNMSEFKQNTIQRNTQHTRKNRNNNICI